MTVAIFPTFGTASAAVNWVEQGKKLLELGLYQEAIVKLEKALQFNPNNHNTWVWRAVALIHLYDYTAALKSLDSAFLYCPSTTGGESDYSLQAISLFYGLVLQQLGSFSKTPDLEYERNLATQEQQSFWQRLTYLFQENAALVPQCSALMGKCL